MKMVHSPDCLGAILQLQYRATLNNGGTEHEYRAYCVGCRSSVKITEQEAKEWNHKLPEAIDEPIEMVKIHVPDV